MAAIIRTFTGLRPNPPEEYLDKGITNAGSKPDYEGALFSDGTVVVRWLTTYRSHSVWASWKDFYLVHGHPDYNTVIKFDDGGKVPAECYCDTGNCEWIYPDGCKVYGMLSPHGCMGPWLPDHEHDLITSSQCGQCGKIVELDPPAKTITEADERTGEGCSCGRTEPSVQKDNDGGEELA